MSKKQGSQDMRALLPWYVNGTLGERERRAVERWLQEEPRAADELAAWQQLRAAVAEQPLQAPSSAVRRRVLAGIAARPRRAWAWGAAWGLLALLLLWSVLRPGIILQWSVSDGPMTAFRIYRAPADGGEFELLVEVDARPGEWQYTYADVRLLPLQSYVYRVEGVGPGGQVSYSRPIAASGLEALPLQLAVLLASLAVGYGAAMLVQRWPIRLRRRLGSLSF